MSTLDREMVEAEIHKVVLALDGISAMVCFLMGASPGDEKIEPAMAGISVLAEDAGRRLRDAADELWLGDRKAKAG